VRIMNDPAHEPARSHDDRAIRRLVADYSDAITHLDARRAAMTYAEDGCVALPGAQIAGRANIEAGMRETFAAFQVLQLIAHAGLIDIDGDRASARWSTVELGIRTGATALSCILGRYEDELIRTPQGWRFAKRVFSLAARALLDTEKLQLDPAFGSVGLFKGASTEA
jgi:ketosteroid isomerase-like protein